MNSGSHPVLCGHTMSSACGPWGCSWRRLCPVCGLPGVEHAPPGPIACLGRLLAAQGPW